MFLELFVVVLSLLRVEFVNFGVNCWRFDLRT